MKSAAIAILPLALIACAMPEPVEPTPPVRKPVESVCEASALQGHIGHTASEKSGAMLLQLSGARSLRWVPPRTAVTMDYRPDRLTVGYDDDMKITRIGCG